MIDVNDVPIYWYIDYSDTIIIDCSNICKIYRIIKRRNGLEKKLGLCKF